MEKDKLLQQLKENLEKAQQYMKKQADKQRKDVKLQVGDLVLMKLQPYKQQSVALRKNQKLGMKYFGPFEVLAKVGEVAYKLKLPNHAKIHPVFHISQLKIFKGEAQEQYLPLPLTMSDTGPIIWPMAILQARTITKGSQKVHQVLVQWDQQPISEATSEDIASLQQKFPLFNLEDKVDFIGEGIVMKSNGSQLLEINESPISHDSSRDSGGGNNSVSGIPQKVEIRKSERARMTSTRLKGYVAT
jgi:hypothetical protein